MANASIEIVDARIKKPYLGGWRNKETNLEYLNAGSQTGPLYKNPNSQNACSEGTQTVEVKEQGFQLPCDKSTQMWRKNCYIPNITDKYLSACEFETDEMMQKRLNKDYHARVIQRNYRAYRLLKFIKESAAKYREILENCRKYEEEKSSIERDRYKDEILRLTYPQKRSDFELLYNLVDKWKNNELEKSRKMHFRASNRAANFYIMGKSVEMLKEISNHRNSLTKDFQRKKYAEFLTCNSKAIKWIGYKGIVIEMITLKTQKARQYKHMYDILRNDSLNTEQRIEILVMLKMHLNLHNCLLAFELIYLIDQEIIFLSREFHSFGMEIQYLRERINCAYLNFLKDFDSCGCKSKYGEPLRNPDNESFQNLKLHRKVNWCKSCKKLLPLNKFEGTWRMKKLSSCKSCSWMTSRKLGQINYEPYEFMLTKIRSFERQRNCHSNLAFALTTPDIYHLVNNIWHGRSIISERRDIYELRLIRFNIDLEWSPWNCILLTEEESQIHYQIRDVNSIYSKHLLKRIFLAHEFAKSSFRYLMESVEKSRESEW